MLLSFSYPPHYPSKVEIQEESNLIAIVDDDQSVTDALRDLLESDGLSVRCFASGEGFLESGLRSKVACLIADIRMPGISGLELQAKLKADKCSPPIIFITAHGDARLRMQAMRAGAVEFLTKPFDHQLLLERVRTTLQRG